jgi:hypothetical protein
MDDGSAFGGYRVIGFHERVPLHETEQCITFVRVVRTWDGRCWESGYIFLHNASKYVFVGYVP